MIPTIYAQPLSIPKIKYMLLVVCIMKARFPSKCPACGDAIKVGKEITRDTQERWVHKYCADDTDELP